jgi:Protein of unknown function with PCYCGC motif
MIMSEHRIRRRRNAVTRRRFLVGGLIVVAGGGAWWWLRASAPAGQQATRDAYGDLVHTVRRGELPAFAKTASADVQQVYRYATDHGETLEYIPCFCGCVRIGHRSNEDCYIKMRNADGTVTYTSHGAT